ncbi:MAG: DUF262 domain-containing protein [Muribaculaceae bacterium]|nr:DUF262 domain-containing protein [Muribaculaceae bacterium]
MSENNFQPRAISDFLSKDEPFTFEIPSFQRGYRWTSKQVEDLLNDLCKFANNEPNLPGVYYLQPLVVRGENKQWEVLDGQQRLTTLTLILDKFRKYGRPYVQDMKLYDIHYSTRRNMKYDSVSPTDHIDGYYIANSRRTIEEWIKAKRNPKELEQMADTLFGCNSKSIKFIWYEVEGDDSSDSGAIAIFNRLNRGKLKLTPSELIKALLIISADAADNRSKIDWSEIDGLNGTASEMILHMLNRIKESARVSGDSQAVLSMEWNEIERRFMHDDFFTFINAGNKKYDTRTDLLFNHIALSKGANRKDDDFAYRWFQEKYDNQESILDIWENDVKKVFDMLMEWYAVPEMYNYIGFLSQCNISIGDIRDRLTKEKLEFKNTRGIWSKHADLNLLRTMVKEQFSPVWVENQYVEFPKAIDKLEYKGNKELIRRVLLLFNVVTYSKRQLRFPFQKYVDEKWDIEHVDSQTHNYLTINSDQENWISYALEIVSELPATDDLKNLTKLMEETLAAGTDSPQWSSNYKEIYDKVMQIDVLTPATPVVDKDSPGNLALLDAGTNRGYGNALFPYKRKKILEREQSGGFVPMCTRDLFLKYFSNTSDSAGLAPMTWSESDAQAHLCAIHKLLDPIFK